MFGSQIFQHKKQKKRKTNKKLNNKRSRPLLPCGTFAVVCTMNGARKLPAAAPPVELLLTTHNGKEVIVPEGCVKRGVRKRGITKFRIKCDGGGP